MPTSYDKIGERQAGDPNILKLKDVNKVRPLDNLVAGWRQHGIEHPSDPEQFASVVCPGPRSCPLCRKPVDAQGNNRFPVSRRFAANIWAYEEGGVKVLVAGPQIFDEFKAAATVSILPDSCDWTITKTGTGRNTEYKVIRHDQRPFEAREITPDMLHDVAKYEMPASTEAIFEILAKMGINYDELEVPSYTYDEALAFVMPYTKHKGLTIEQLVQNEQEYALWMHGTKLEQGQLGDPVFLALQVVLEQAGLAPELDDALAQLPDSPAPAADPTPAPQSSGSGNGTAERMVPLMSPAHVRCEIPEHAVDSLLAVGYELIEETPPEPAEPATMMVLVAGNPTELPTEAAKQLLATGAAQLPGSEPEPEPPALPLPDEPVQVTVGGSVVPMPFVTAAQLVDSGSAEFVDPQVTAAHERAKANAAAQPDPSQTQGPAQSSTSPPADPEKPFRCDQCDAAYKTQGALTQHKNREHKAAQPQPSAIPASNGDAGDVRARVKQLISSGNMARDYETLLGILQEETGTQDFTKLNDAQLLKVETRLKAELAKA